MLLAQALSPLALPLPGMCAEARSIDFTFGAESPGLDSSILKTSYRKLGGEDYKAIGATYSVWTSLNMRGDFRFMITCDAIIDPPDFPNSPQRMKNVQLLLVEDKDGALKPIQRFKLGDGEAPRFVTARYDTSPDAIPAEGPDPELIHFMVTIIRGGNNTEAFVYSMERGANGKSGDLKISEKLRVNRSLPSKMGIKVSGTLEMDGFIEVRAVKPDKREMLDLREATDALMEDGLYQMNARPVPSMRSLICVRNGWEGEDIVIGADGSPELRVGLTLITPS
ncbi:MAG: hypothetical protein LBS93_08645, partial [Synergistaceae bacterium]|nr:hypothetical protein [Synergistaceae bacterium]